MQVKTAYVGMIISALLVASSASFGAGKAKPQVQPAGGASASQSVWVARPDGSQSCGIQGGQTVEEGAKELANAKIRVLSSHKANDGKMRIQVCGAPTGSVNAYEIQRSDLPRAIALGYQEAEARPTAN